MPTSRGVKTAAWTPVLLAEYLVHEGTLEDASSKQSGEQVADGEGHLAVLRGRSASRNECQLAILASEYVLHHSPP